MLPMIEGCIGTPTSHITAFPARQTNPYQIIQNCAKAYWTTANCTKHETQLQTRGQGVILKHELQDSGRVS